MRDSFLRLTLLQLKFRCFKFFHCEIKQIHQKLNFRSPVYSSLPEGPTTVEGAVNVDSVDPSTLARSAKCPTETTVAFSLPLQRELCSRSRSRPSSRATLPPSCSRVTSSPSEGEGARRPACVFPRALFGPLRV